MRVAQDNELKWFRLDNTAKVYPVLTSEKSSHVYRIAINLVAEIDPAALQKAVEDCKGRFPTFYVKLRKGLFWYYYEINEKPPIVKEESSYVCSPIDRHANNGYFFTFFYYRNRISLEIFHSISDGKGALEFLKTVVCRYLEILGYTFDDEGLLLKLDQKPSAEEIEDSYLKNYHPAKKKIDKHPRAYHTSGERFPQGGLGIINCTVNTDELSRLAKSNNVTITQFLTGLLTYAIIQTGDIKKLDKRPVTVCVPIDMRRFYKSKTLRNFFLLFRTSIQCEDKRKPELSEILKIIKEQFAGELNMEKLQNSLNVNVSLEKNFAAKFVPLALKWVFIRIGNMISSGLSTTITASNLGTIELPSGMIRFVSNFEVNFVLGSQFTHSLSIMSFNCKTRFGFTRRIIETDIEKYFLTYLSENGLDISVQSNHWEDYII